MNLRQSLAFRSTTALLISNLCYLLFWGSRLPASFLEDTKAVVPIRFRDVAQSAGLEFVLDNNATPEKHMIETMAGGVAAFDYNGDGRMDIFFTNGARIPSLEKEKALYPFSKTHQEKTDHL